jgi:hypothetical protein
MKFKYLLFFSLLVASLQAASVVDLTFTLNGDGTEYGVVNCDQNASGSLDIPSSYQGVPVTSIVDSAFYQCTGLTSITIPDSVTSIGNYAFYACSGLTSVTLPDSVTSIGDYAFYACSGLTSVTLPDSVTSIGFESFSGCTSLTSIVVAVDNPNYSSIGPLLLNKNGDQLFTGAGASGDFTIPNSVTYIWGSAFSSSTSLTSITIPNKVTYIGDYAFSGCTSLTSIVVAVDNPNYSSIGPLLLNKNGDLLITAPTASGDFTIPDSVTRIGRIAFSGAGLTSITIPDSVTSIGDQAFAGCTGLTSVTIGSSVTYIGSNQFIFCPNLTDISLNSASVNLRGAGFYDYVTSINISEGTVQIADYAFYNCYKVTNIIIPDSVTSIGNEAFRFCSGLTSITFEGPPPAFNISTLTDTNSEPILYYKAFPQMYSVYKETYNLPMVYLGPPTIDVQPQGAIASIGETVNLSVSATDVEGSQLSYQWMRNGVDLSQETAASLSITSIASTDSGSYQVKVSNTAGTTTSEAASVTLVASDLYTQQQFDTALSSGFALGVSTVQDNAANYGLVAEENIEDARAGSSSIQVTNGTATLQLQIERSEDLSNWTSHQDDLISIPLQINADSQFFRFAIP